MNSLNPNPTERNLKHMSTAVTLDPFNGLRLFEDAVTRLMSEPRAEPARGRPPSTFSKPKMP